MEFKPGTYQKGDIVTVNGVEYIADRDILNALAIPKDNMYWTKVESEPIPTLGLSPNNTPEQNSNAIDALINSSNSIHIPAGEYHFARTIHLRDRAIKITGDNGTIFSPYATRLIFPDGVTGIKFSRGTYQEPIIQDLCLIAKGKTVVSNASGIQSDGRIRIIRCTAKGFYWNGFDLWGNMEGTSTDVSGSYLEGCHALENRQDGFFAGRTDGNAVVFIACDARDNGRHGFNDDSFLGNNYFGCMAHYNAGGDFDVRDWNNTRTVLVGCYSEGGNTPSQLGERTTVIGGTWGSSYNIGTQQGKHGSYIKDYAFFNDEIAELKRDLDRKQAAITDIYSRL
jgi:hypothetical protein